jgi:hypothetical protein
VEVEVEVEVVVEAAVGAGAVVDVVAPSRATGRDSGPR